ncbi:unnamed protein product, partial [Brassica oleracea]
FSPCLLEEDLPISVHLYSLKLSSVQLRTGENMNRFQFQFHFLGLYDCM